MRQLALPIQSLSVPTLDNFVCGRNAEVLQELRGLPLSSRPETLLYLWGPEGCGKTHLLRGLEAALVSLGRPPLYLAAPSTDDLPPYSKTALLIDDIEAGSANFQERVFYRWNQIRESGGTLVVSGQHAPGQLPIAPELSSRLAWGQIFRLEALNDSEKKEALRQEAERRHIPLSEEALDYLLTHVQRDMPSLMHILQRLDTQSLAEKRAITIPLIREWLQNQRTESP